MADDEEIKKIEEEVTNRLEEGGVIKEETPTQDESEEDGKVDNTDESPQTPLNKKETEPPQTTNKDGDETKTETSGQSGETGKTYTKDKKTKPNIFKRAIGRMGGFFEKHKTTKRTLQVGGIVLFSPIVVPAVAAYFLLKGMGFIFKGAKKFIGYAGGIKNAIEGQQKGAYDWLIWAGIILHIIFWRVYNFTPNPTFTTLNYIILIYLLIRNYGIFQLDQRKLTILASMILVYNIIIPFFANMYPILNSLQAWLIFPFVMALSDIWVAAFFFLQIGGTDIIGALLPVLNTNILAIFFIKAWYRPAWMALLGAGKSESNLSHIIMYLYVGIVCYFVFTGGAIADLGKQMGIYADDSVGDKAAEEIGQLKQQNWWDANLVRGGVCIAGVIGRENGDLTQCAKIGQPPDPTEEEGEMSTGGIDQNIEQEVTMEWSADPLTVSSSDKTVNMLANLYVLTLKKDIGVDLECGIKNVKDSGIPIPNELKIEARNIGTQEAVKCRLVSKKLPQKGSKTIVFKAKALDSQLDIESKYTFYATEGSYLDRKVDEFLTDKGEYETFHDERNMYGLPAAMLNLYKKVLPQTGTVENMDEKIKEDYPNYPVQKIESLSEPSFIKVKINVNNDVPFVGIEKDLAMVFWVSVENRVEDGIILGVNKGTLELPYWLEPSESCDFLNKNTEKKISESRHSYEIAEDQLNFDWTVIKKGFKDRKVFDSCLLKVTEDPNVIFGRSQYDLNSVKVNVNLVYDFEITGTGKLIVEKSTSIDYKGRLESFPVLHANENDFGDDFGVEKIGEDRKHEGIDIFAPNGTNIVAVVGGEIIRMSCDELGGNRIGIIDEYGDYFYYAHFSEYDEGLKIGDNVVADQVIGKVGDTIGCRKPCNEELCGIPDDKTSPHLHFGIYEGLGGTPLNPYDALVEALG